MKKIILLSLFIVSNIFIMINTIIVYAGIHHNQNNLPSLSNMLETVIPSVVSINVEGNSSIKTDKLPQQFQPFFGNNSPFCQEGSPFNGLPMCQDEKNKKQKFRVLGSGVIVDSVKGYIVTNNHVVDNAIKIKVQIHDGQQYEAKIIGQDPLSDIALIQLKKFKKLIAIKISDSEILKVGDYAVAIGNPYGLGETVTLGIISALGRSGLNADNYENFIQTDAAINRGNSGGALVNLNGELIGINTAILAPDGGNIGIGFAIPSNMVKNLIIQMVKYGQVKRGELGILGTDLNAELSKSMKIDKQKGAFVSQVLSNSSAEDSGVKSGDIIISVNNKNITSFSSLRAYIGTLPMDSKITLNILRNKQEITLQVELKQRKKNIFYEQDYLSNKKILEQVNIIEGAELINFYDIYGKKGVKVKSIQSNSFASRIDLRKEDIIISVNQQIVNNIDDLKKLIKSNNNLILKVKRNNSNIYLFMQ